MSKKVLLIGGGGTLGTHTYAELIRLGHKVDVICLEDFISDNEKLNFIKAKADFYYLTKFLENKHYDGIVNFIHYTSVDEYKPVHMLLSEKTDQLIFLSSYRVYADEQHPLTETAPQLLNTVGDDEEFLKTEDYAIPKSKNELFIRNESNTRNWTIVRPVISFSQRRFDVVLTSGREVVDKAKTGEIVYVPEFAKNLTAGLDWSGNSGKLIANLLFKKEALGEAFTVSSGQNLTWGEIADIYIYRYFRNKISMGKC